MKTALAAILLVVFVVVPVLAQDGLLPAGDHGLKKRSWVLMDTQMTVRGERLVEVPDAASGEHKINYVAFYIKGELVAIDEIPPFKITWDFGPYTQKARVVAIGVQYELPAAPALEEVSDTRVAATADGGSMQKLDGTLKFTAPSAEQYVYGVVTIAAETDLPPDQVLRVDFLVNGVIVGSAVNPPYAVEHDFGRGFDPFRLQAVAYLKGGGQLTAEMSTKPLEKSDYLITTRLVTLDATVTDYRDRLIGDLKQADFRIWEDGKEQKITHFAVEERPIRVALLIDVSSSMQQRGKMQRAIQAAQGFLRFLKKGQDKAALIAFNDLVHPLSGFTDDFGKVGTMIGKLEAMGGTAINDTLDAVAPMFEDETGRKAIVLVTDGLDEHSSKTTDEAIEKVRAMGIKVYSIGILDNDYYTREMQESFAEQKPLQGKRPNVDPTDARKGDRTFKRGDDPRTILFEGLADETGGAAFFPERLEELPMVFNRIADELRHMYTLGYVSTNPANDGKWREIRVETTRDGASVRTKRGYYAEK